jgi:hypothetical protein
LSNIRTGTISGVNGTDPVTLTKQSAAKVWIQYNSRSTTSVGSSSNVSSISDDGTGSTSINFTASMSDANFCQTMGLGDMNTTWTTSHAMATTNDGSKTSSRTKFHTGGHTVGEASDLYENCVMVMGDLA